jgi:hypothetical protein
MARRSLERKVEACLLVLAYRVPVCVRVDHRPPRQAAVELRESGGVAALQGDSAHFQHRSQPSTYLVWSHRRPTLTGLCQASCSPPAREAS